MARDFTGPGLLGARKAHWVHQLQVGLDLLEREARLATRILLCTFSLGCADICFLRKILYIVFFWIKR